MAGDTEPAGLPLSLRNSALADRLGSWKARWSIGRMSYLVPPGLYAIGTPAPDDPVLVTANYKMSYDIVRRALGGRNVWLLVLETYGINVWCAAGKGTFGTGELVRRVETVRLGEIVNHRLLLVPILGAAGVSAHEVKRRTGFTVHYATIRASDLAAYLDAGMSATPEMRELTFTAIDRLVLTPVEMVAACKFSIPRHSPSSLSWRDSPEAAFPLAAALNTDGCLYRCSAGRNTFSHRCFCPGCLPAVLPSRGPMPGMSLALHPVLRCMGSPGTNHLGCRFPGTSGGCSVPCPQLYRKHPVHLPLRGEKGDAACVSCYGCCGPNRSGLMGGRKILVGSERNIMKGFEYLRNVATLASTRLPASAAAFAVRSVRTRFSPWSGKRRVLRSRRLHGVRCLRSQLPCQGAYRFVRGRLCVWHDQRMAADHQPPVSEKAAGDVADRFLLPEEKRIQTHE